jgi:hypothetical protein
MGRKYKDGDYVVFTTAFKNINKGTITKLYIRDSGLWFTVNGNHGRVMGDDGKLTGWDALVEKIEISVASNPELKAIYTMGYRNG